MLGSLTINMDPSYISFESSKYVRRSRYCKIEELRDLLVELNIYPSYQALPNNECIIKLKGDFPMEVLCRHGLARHVLTR